MLDFKINEDKCTECGLCSKDCPTLIIDGKKGIPEIKEGKEGMCIKCQHCLAVCPTGALSILGKNPDDSVLVKDETPSPIALQNLIKTRRTIRKFKDEELSAEELQDLLETAAYAPTGHNKNGVLISITETKSDRDKVRSLIYDGIKKAMVENTMPEGAGMFASFQKVWENKNIDVIFRDAPHIIFASAPTKVMSSVADCTISLSYLELYANTKGLGTLWNGFAMNVMTNITPQLKTTLGIPEDHTIGYIMILGKPTVKYTRAVQSEGLHVNKISL